MPKLDAGTNQADKAKIEALKAWEQMVIRHEHMHLIAGGMNAKAPVYVYEKGPDGKSYIRGGQVSLSLPNSGSPAQTIDDLRQVERAALINPNPSNGDIAAAGLASARRMQASREYAQMQIRAKVEAERMENLRLQDHVNVRVDSDGLHDDAPAEQIDHTIRRSWTSPIARMSFRFMTSFDMMF